MVTIPDRFSLLNRDYVVHHATPTEQEAFDDFDGQGSRMLGCCDPEDARVILGEHRNREAFEHTYFHELAHALLFAIREDLSVDESLVDALGGALHQYEKTKAGRLAMQRRKNGNKQSSKKSSPDAARQRMERLVDRRFLGRD